MYKATITSNQDNYHHKIYYGITETKIQIAICKQHKILNFQMNYRVLKTTTTPQILYGKYFENTRRITLTPKDVPSV